LAEEVEELYFPEKVPFWPFGDPLEDHADLRQRRTNQKTSAQARRTKILKKEKHTQSD